MKRLAIAAALVVALASPAQAAESGEEPPQTFYNHTWVCTSPEAYATAVQREAETPRDKFGALKVALLEERLCMLVDEEQLEDMMAPFVQVKETQGEMVKVEFIIEFYRKVEFLHRRITRVFYTGWTDQANLRNYHEWLTGKPQS